MPLLEVSDLRVGFHLKEGPFKTLLLRAVAGVSLAVERGESVGLVGESGCGKTTLGNAVLGLIRPSGGRILFDGQDVGALRGAALRRFRERAQMVFQDPFGSLNPRMSVGAAIEEVLMIHRAVPRCSRRERAAELLGMVGMEPDYLRRYPHELSGGQRQRVGIARALAVRPSLLIADEPVSALDVSVQVQILNLMKDLQTQMGLSYLFIAHDLAVVRYMCHRVLVMYLGKVVESGRAGELLERPAHPYTHALLSAVPDVEKGLRSRVEGSRRIILKGDVPSATRIPAGCPFHPRCPRAQEVCRTQAPAEHSVAPGHTSVCHFADELAKTPAQVA